MSNETSENRKAPLGHEGPVSIGQGPLQPLLGGPVHASSERTLGVPEDGVPGPVVTVGGGECGVVLETLRAKGPVTWPTRFHGVRRISHGGSTRRYRKRPVPNVLPVTSLTSLSTSRAETGP